MATRGALGKRYMTLLVRRCASGLKTTVSASLRRCVSHLVEVIEAAAGLAGVDIVLDKVLAPARNCRLIVQQVCIRERWGLPHNGNDRK